MKIEESSGQRAARVSRTRDRNAGENEGDGRYVFCIVDDKYRRQINAGGTVIDRVKMQLLIADSPIDPV